MRSSHRHWSRICQVLSFFPLSIYCFLLHIRWLMKFLNENCSIWVFLFLGGLDFISFISFQDIILTMGKAGTKSSVRKDVNRFPKGRSERPYKQMQSWQEFIKLGGPVVLELSAQVFVFRSVKRNRSWGKPTRRKSYSCCE